MNKNLVAVLCSLSTLASPRVASAADSDLNGVWMVGLNLGELPWQGSFKPGVSVGYHVNDLMFIGGFYQIGDSIQRNGTSFNVQNTSLDGILSSTEDVASRAFLGVRLRPHRYSPFASLGFVYNGADTETMRFDARSRQIGAGTYDGEITIVQRRTAAVRPALGLGYSYTFDWGLELSTAWSSAIRREYDVSTCQRGELTLRRNQGRLTCPCCTRPRSLTFVVPLKSERPDSRVRTRSSKYLSSRRLPRTL